MYRVRWGSVPGCTNSWASHCAGVSPVFCMVLCSKVLSVHFMSLLTILVIIMINLNSKMILLRCSTSAAPLIKERFNALIWDMFCWRIESFDSHVYKGVHFLSRMENILCWWRMLKVQALPAADGFVLDSYLSVHVKRKEKCWGIVPQTR